jgi:uncharacterized protein
MQTPEYWISHLNLTAHPEGGYFSEIYRNKEVISDTELTQKYSGKRNLATSIYFLLKHGEVSKLHRLKSDEIWYYHYGSPLIVHVFHEGKYTQYQMGCDASKNEVFQVILPASSIFGAEVETPNGFTLVGCMVSPGFHFDDFELISKTKFETIYHADHKLINRLT